MSSPSWIRLTGDGECFKIANTGKECFLNPSGESGHNSVGEDGLLDTRTMSMDGVIAVSFAFLVSMPLVLQGPLEARMFTMDTKVLDFTSV